MWKRTASSDRARSAPRVTAFTATCAAGAGRAELLGALCERRSGLRANDFTRAALPAFIGRVRGLEAAPLPPALAAFESRNNRLAWLGLAGDGFMAAARAACDRYGAQRVSLVLGTSTSSIDATEDAYARLTPAGELPPDALRSAVHSPHSTGEFVAHVLGVGGVAVTVSTACSSSAKAFAQGARLLARGIADAVVVAGVDSLCGSVLFGFNALALISPEPCRPFDLRRSGISLGEAAGFALLERTGAGPTLLGCGESSDAHHMSTPHPSGRGARDAIRQALERAEITAGEVDYINLHGTATPKNDEIEAGIVADLFPAHTHAASTKGWTGHTLGAAGIVEAVIALLALESGVMPGNLNAHELDPACGPQIRLDNARGAVRVAMSTSFGFGGSNCVLLFGAAA